MAEGRLPVGPIWTDVHTFPAERFRGVVDGVVGGYPCQSFSHDGQRRGHEDPRHLWPSIARILRAVEPLWCVFENVAGHLSLGAREVISDLHGLGYDVAGGLFTAAEVGAPHRRERLFLVAHRDRPRSQGTGLEQSAQRGQPESLLRDGATLPPWPPGPADSAGWAWVLERWPELAPALPVADARTRILRDGAHLASAMERLDEERARLVTKPGRPDRVAFEAASTVLVLRAVARAALWREESRGAHFRSDFPERDDARFAVHSRQSLDGPVRGAGRHQRQD